MIYSIQKPTTWAFIFIIIVLIISYGGFRIYPLLAGPKIEIYQPKEGEVVRGNILLVSGKVLRSSEIKLQGRPITINTGGEFTETLIAHTPYTILVLEATDKYGKKASKILRIAVTNDEEGIGNSTSTNTVVP